MAAFRDLLMEMWLQMLAQYWCWAFGALVTCAFNRIYAFLFFTVLMENYYLMTILSAISAALFVGGCAVLGNNTQTFGPMVVVRTWLLQRCSTFSNRKDRLFAARKLTFTSCVAKTSMRAHTHPGNAQLRADASKFIDKIGNVIGGRRYDVSISSREAGRGTVGARLMRTPKDLLSDDKHDMLRTGDMVSMIDTDCHMSLEELNSYAGHDIAMYTLRPGGLSGKGPESSWRFISPTTVQEDVSGGASYCHEVWDWGKDMVVLSKGCKTVVYDPISYPVGEGREVVLLLKARTIWLPLLLVNFLVPGIKDCMVARMGVEQHGKYLLGVFGKPGNRKVELLNSSLPDIDKISLPTTHWSALQIMSRAVNPDSKKAELRPSDVERYLNGVKMSIGASGCYHVSDYFTGHHRALRAICYQSMGALETEVGEVNSYTIAPGPVAPAMSPVNSENNNDRALTERLVKVANTKAFPEDIIGYAAEFAQLVVPKSDEGKTVPLSTSEVASRQNAPSQRQRREKDKAHLALKAKVLPIQAFMKHEAGPSVSDPRSINQVPVDQTCRLSRFMLASASFLKQRCKRWYAPGKNNKEMGRSLQNLVKKQGKQVGGDYSRMDGRTSVAYREHVFEPIVKRMFAEEYQEELKELLERERVAKIRMRKGRGKATTTGSNLSGSPATTQLNTLNAAFNEYAARRRAGQTPREAYEALGLYFGDDSVFAQPLAAAVTEVSNELGMKMTIEDEPEGSPPGRVVFLSRVYPDVLTTIHSYPCMVRALAKMQVTTNDMGKTEKGRQIMRVLKGTASQMVNGHVPIIGPYSRVLQGSGPEVSEADKAKACAMDRDLNWQLTSRAKQPEVTLSSAELDLFTASIARDLSIPPEEVRRLDALMRSCKDVASLSQITLAGGDAKLPEWAVWVG